MSVEVRRRTVVISARVLGIHYWSDAPAVVGYLRSPHRHEFHVRVEWNVTHADRDVEFHIAQGWVRQAFSRRAQGPTEPISFGPMSCEMIAEQLNSDLVKMGVPAANAIEISEDGENGARVEFVLSRP